MQKLSPEDKRKIWQTMELMRLLKKDQEKEVSESATLAEDCLESILEKLNARERP